MINDFTQNKLSFYTFIYLGPKLMTAALLVIPGFLQLIQNLLEFYVFQYFFLINYHKIDFLTLTNLHYYVI